MHFYDAKTAAPRYEVPCSTKEGMRPARISDARKHGWYPSVTEIMNVLAKPGLEQYKINQAILAALTLPRIEGEPDDDLLKRIKHDAKEHAKQAALKGEEIHDAVAAIYDGRGIYHFDATVRDCAEKVRNYLDAMGLHSFTAELPFVDPRYGYGGRVDLVDREKQVILDLKTTEKHLDRDSKEKKLNWPEHKTQLAAYGHAIFGREFDCDFRAINIYVDYSGHVTHHEWELNYSDFILFENTLLIWKIKKNYYPEASNG